MNRIGENIRKLRLEKNLTQKEIADKLFVTRQCISRWEQGKTIPDISSIEKLAEIFNCNINNIIDNDSIKRITITEAIKSQRSKKIIITSIIISFLAIVLSIFGIYLINKNKEASDKNIKYIRAIVYDITDYEVIFKLDKSQIEDEQSDQLVLSLFDLKRITVFDNHQNIIESRKLKKSDIVQLLFNDKILVKNLKYIYVIDSKVEKNFYGVIVITNGERYNTYEEIPFDDAKGIRYFIHNQSFNSSNTKHNLDVLEAKANYSYDTLNGEIVNPRYEFEMNIYIDKVKKTNNPVIGLIYSTGIEYVEELDNYSFYYKEYDGELGYELPQNYYFNNSVDLKFKLNIFMISSINKIEVYEYDSNNELLEVSTIYNWNDFFDYSANKDSLYAYIKEYYTIETIFGTYETFKTYRLNVGEEFSVPIADEYCLIWTHTFTYSFKGF